MNGFRLRWRIENKYPPLETKSSEVGKSICTPGFRDGDIDVDYYLHDHSLISILIFPKDLAKHVESGSLVIQLEVDISAV